MKKMVILLILVLVIITGCNSKENGIEGISISIKEGTLTNTSATIIIKDTTNKNYSYDDEFYIEKKTDNKWKKLKCNNCWFNLPVYRVNENKILELSCNWELMYGELEKGKYKLVKKVDSKEISIEFTINN